MRRTLLIASIAVLILVGLGVGTTLLINRTPKLKNALEQKINTNISVNTNAAVDNTNLTVSNTNTDAEREAIIFVARNFTERFGTGSTDDKFAGMLSATTWGTVSLNDNLRKNIITLYGNPGTTYRSFETKALVFSFTRRTDATAALTIGTLRTETIDRSAKSYNQNLQLTLIKSGGLWKVDSANWEPR